MDDFARVKDAVDLVDVVKDYVELKRAGARMVGCCPFHAEKSPSFGIPIGQQFFKCFGCGKGGDVFTFLAEIEHIERVEALHRLAEARNITLSGGHGANRDEKERLLRALAAAQELHRKAFASPIGAAARELVTARKLTPAIVEAFGLGYGPIEPGRRFDSAVIANRLVKAGHRREDVAAAGVAVERDGGALLDAAYARDRVTIPIRDERGRVVAFGGRRLRDGQEGEATRDPKYVNSRETLLFSKGRLLYGLDRARASILKEQRVVLVEGYLDVILAHQGGLDVAVAALGTSVTSEHAKQLARLAPKAVLFLDGDPAGQRAAERAVPLLLAEKLEVRVLVLTSDKDPGDYFARGATRDDFEKLLASDGVSGLDYLLERAGRREARSIDDKVRVARKVGEALALVVDPLARAGHVTALERELDLPHGSLEAALALRRDRRPMRPAAVAEPGSSEGGGSGGAVSGNGDGKVPPDRQEAPALPRAQVTAEEEVLLALMQEPALRAEAGRWVPPGAFADPARAALFHALVEDPAAEASRVLEAVLGKLIEEPDAQQKLADLVHRPASAEPGKRFDGAVRWLVEQRRRQSMDEVRARFETRLKRGDSTAAAEFLQAFEAARRAGGPN
jgi:DNA primase